MTALRRELRAIQKRIRWGRSLSWGYLGLTAGAGLGLLVKASSFFRPMAWGPELCLLCALGAMALSAALGFFWPVPAADAARRADGCGLRARVQTAMELQAGEETPMVLLQREDARQALIGVAWREAIPLRHRRFAIIIAAGFMMATAGLFFMPKQQDDMRKAQASFTQELAKQATLLEEGSDRLEGRDARETHEHRKLLGDLARDLRTAQSPREALTAIDRAEHRLENLRQNNGASLREALAGKGMNDIARALEERNGQALREALEREDAQELARALSEAADSADSQDAADSLRTASEAAASGNISGAQSALHNLTSLSLGAAGQCEALLQMARTSAARAGQSTDSAGQANQARIQAALSLQAGNRSTGSGMTPNQGGGGGAGRGSTNLDAGYQEESGRSPQQGNAKSERKMGFYEVIYDPTRLGNGGEVTRERGEIGLGETSEAALGAGLGGISEGVPYPEVALEYQESAVQAVESANLPTHVRKWVETYFTSLLK